MTDRQALREQLWQRAHLAWDERRDPLEDPDVEALLLEHPELLEELDRARLALVELVPTQADEGAEPASGGPRLGLAPLLLRRAAALLASAAAAACLVWLLDLSGPARLEPTRDAGQPLAQPFTVTRPIPGPTLSMRSARVVSVRLTVSVQRPGTGVGVDRAVDDRSDTRRLTDQPLARGASPVRDLCLSYCRSRPWIAP